MNLGPALDPIAWARATDMLDCLGAFVRDARGVVAPGQPIPKERPRHRGRQTFTPKRTRDAEDAVALFMRRLGPVEGNVALACIFYRADRRLVDGDNLFKLVADAGIKARVWENDYQVTGGVFALELDCENPRTFIAVAPHDSTLAR